VSNAVATNKAAGEMTEFAVDRILPSIRLIPDDIEMHYDAVATSAFFPGDLVSMLECISVQRGTVIEIKSTIRRLTSGQRGRFYLRPDQHASLVEADGVYAFAVCTDDERDILALKIVPAEIVDELVSSWIDPGPTRSNYAQLSWSNIFDVREVETR